MEIVLSAVLFMSTLNLIVYYIQFRRTTILASGIAYYALDLARSLTWVWGGNYYILHAISITTVVVLLIMSIETRRAMK